MEIPCEPFMVYSLLFLFYFAYGTITIYRCVNEFQKSASRYSNSKCISLHTILNVIWAFAFRRMPSILYEIFDSRMNV